jgi:16S rRNA (adenine1518-N6/adenine1519-N6)-dimethyltransferase
MQAKKRFGQNFLQDPSVIAQIIDSIRPQAHQMLIEIGPGRGALTDHLAQSHQPFSVIELDRDLIPGLQQKLPDSVEIIEADVLKYDFSQFSMPLFVVGNLPYNISTPLLFKLFEQVPQPEHMIFMLQREVVDRLIAGPGSKAYGRLSVMAQYHCRIQKVLDVPANAFKPAPRVDSAVVELQPHSTQIHGATDPGLLSEVLVSAFGQRRKTLRNAMSQLITAEQLSSLDIDPTLRAEALTVQQFIDCANFLSAHR